MGAFDYLAGGFSGASSGAAAGSSFGPKGMAAGAGAGLLMGLVGAGGSVAQKRAMERWAKRQRELGYRVGGMYDERGRQNINRFDRAGGALTDFGGRKNLTEPMYNEMTGRHWGPTRQEKLYEGRQGSRGPTQTRDWYSTYRPTNQVQGRYQHQLSGSPPQSALDERYNISRTQGPGVLLQNRGQFQSYAAQPNQFKGRYDELRGKLSGDPFAARTSLREGADPAAAARAAKGGLRADLLTARTTDMAGRIMDRNTETGRLLAGPLGTETLLKDFRGGGGDSGAFLREFDPNATRGLGATYETLAGEGPTYEEQFYLSQLAGSNPAYNQLKTDFEQDLRRAAAAGGGFASGRTKDLTMKGLSRLAADEFARRGDLASMAGEARRSQLGQRLQGAQALDAHVLQGQGLRQDTAMGRDRMAADLAGEGDRTRSGLAQFSDSQLADLAKFGDTQAFSVEELRGKLAMHEDEMTERNRSALDALSKMGADYGLSREEMLNSVLSRGADEDRYRMDLLLNYGRSADEGELARQNRLDALAGNLDDDRFRERSRLDDLAVRASDEADRSFRTGLEGARSASDEEARWDDYLRDIAAGADTSRLDSDKFLSDLAGDTEKAYNDNLKSNFDMAMRLGDAQSALQMAYDMAAIGAITEGELGAMRLMLQRAGMDAAQIQSHMDDIQGAAALYMKYRQPSGGGGGVDPDRTLEPTRF